MSDLSFRLLGETPHPQGAVHEHGVFQGDQQVGSVKVLALKAGGIGGFKVAGGLKSGHFGAVTDYIKKQHGDLNMGAAKPMNKATVAQQNEDLSGVNLDHDRIRVMRAIQALAHGIETPHTPDGKVNAAKKKRLRKAIESGDLAKAVPAMQRMSDIHARLRTMADDFVTRPEFNTHHDHAAYMMAHARHQLDMADRHMHLEKPRFVDKVHAALRMKPAYEKHLNAADTFIRAASNHIHHGDNTLFRMRVTESIPSSQLTPMSMLDKVTVRRAYQGPIGRLPDSMVRGAASELQRHYAYAAAKNPSGAAAPAATPATAKPSRSKKPRPADNA